jgi:hypothetical protein
MPCVPMTLWPISRGHWKSAVVNGRGMTDPK